MKSYRVLLLLLMCNSIPSFGQKLSISDMIKLSKSNDDEFDTYVTQKGYKLVKREKDFSHSTFHPMVTTYAYRQDGYTLGAAYFITKMITEEGLAHLEYQTAYRADYLNLKSQLKAMGYEYVSSSTVGGGAISLRYNKGHNDFELISGPAKNSLGEQTTAYTLNYLYVAQ